MLVELARNSGCLSRIVSSRSLRPRRAPASGPAVGSGARASTSLPPVAAPRATSSSSSRAVPSSAPAAHRPESFGCRARPDPPGAPDHRACSDRDPLPNPWNRYSAALIAPRDTLDETLFAFLAHERVRIFAVGQEHERQLVSGGQRGQRDGQRLPGRLAPGVVAVEAADDLRRMRGTAFRNARRPSRCRASRPRWAVPPARARRRPCSPRRRAGGRFGAAPSALRTNRRAPYPYGRPRFPANSDTSAARRRVRVRRIRSRDPAYCGSET